MSRWILQLAAAAVSAALLLLTGRGALALTGSTEVSLVLGALVVIQWVCAHKALALLRRTGESGGLPVRLVRALGVASLWMAAALVTVPLVGAELFGMLAAQRIGEARLAQARQVLLTRAVALESDLRALNLAVQAVAAYAGNAGQREQTEGSTCWRSGPNPTGKVRSFWIGEQQTASALAAATEVSTRAAVAARTAVEAISTGGATAGSRASIAAQAVALEQLRSSNVAASTEGFVAARLDAGERLFRDGKVTGCADAGRVTLLGQVHAAAAALPMYHALSVPALFDPADHKGISQGALMRTWGAVLQMLPQQWIGGWTPIAREDAERFGVPDKVLVSDATLPLALAWILEAVVLALMLLQGRRADVTVGKWGGAWQALVDGLGQWLAGRSGLVGRIARRAAAGMDPGGVWREASRVGRDLFPDASMRRRAEGLVTWRCPYGGGELILVPLAEEEHLLAAYELEHAGLLRRVAGAVRTNRLLRDVRLAPILRAGRRNETNSHWAVFRVASDRFAAWLLAQPASAPVAR